MTKKSTLEYIKRILPWLGRILYGSILILLTQAAWSSLYENEPRAAVIYFSIVVVLILAGLLSRISRYYTHDS